MTSESLIAVHKAVPFQPYMMHLADGRSIIVKHPESVMYVKNQRSITVSNEDDAQEVIDLLLVVSLRPLRPGKE